jgi:hypothetical protein
LQPFFFTTAFFILTGFVHTTFLCFFCMAPALFDPPVTPLFPVTLVPLGLSLSLAWLLLEGQTYWPATT